MKHLILTSALVASALMASGAQAAQYRIDKEGAHASINFKIQHLGYSWLTGRFNDFEGQFSYDEKMPEKSTIEVVINTKSLDSNHAERDKHLKGKDFLNVGKFPQAKFKSSEYKVIDENSAIVTGSFELNGVTKNISFPVTKIGAGNDPWGGYRMGFEGKTSLKLADYGISYNLGPASTVVELSLYIEGIRQ
jgi:polyisoprenoid-binding protein YceI